MTTATLKRSELSNTIVKLDIIITMIRFPEASFKSKI